MKAAEDWTIITASQEEARRLFDLRLQEGKYFTVLWNLSNMPLLCEFLIAAKKQNLMPEAWFGVDGGVMWFEMDEVRAKRLSTAWREVFNTDIPEGLLLAAFIFVPRGEEGGHVGG